MNMRMPLLSFFVIGVFSSVESAINLAELIKTTALFFEVAIALAKAS